MGRDGPPPVHKVRPSVTRSALRRPRRTVVCHARESMHQAHEPMCVNGLAGERDSQACERDSKNRHPQLVKLRTAAAARPVTGRGRTREGYPLAMHHTHAVRSPVPRDRHGAAYSYSRHSRWLARIYYITSRLGDEVQMRSGRRLGSASDYFREGHLSEVIHEEMLLESAHMSYPLSRESGLCSHSVQRLADARRRVA